MMDKYKNETPEQRRSRVLSMKKYAEKLFAEDGLQVIQGKPEQNYTVAFKVHSEK